MRIWKAQEKTAVIILKFKQCVLKYIHAFMCAKDADGMANCVDSE